MEPAKFGINKICKDKKNRNEQNWQEQKINAWLIRSPNTYSWVGGQKRPWCHIYYLTFATHSGCFYNLFMNQIKKHFPFKH